MSYWDTSVLLILRVFVIFVKLLYCLEAKGTNSNNSEEITCV